MKKSLESMKKSGLSLALFAMVSVILVVSTNRLTKETIAKNDKLLLLKTINEIIPSEYYDNDLANTILNLDSQNTGFEKPVIVYIATLKGNPAYAVFKITTLKGYGVITLLIGINAKDQSLAGVRVVHHTETPGLGDKIEIKKDDWILSFDGKSLGNPNIKGWAVKKDGGDFDQFTGATITPRAIVNVVKSTLLYTKDNLNDVFVRSLKKQKRDAMNSATEGNQND